MKLINNKFSKSQYTIYDYNKSQAPILRLNTLIYYAERILRKYQSLYDCYQKNTTMISELSL